MATLSIQVPLSRPDLGRTGDHGSTFRGASRGRGGTSRGDRSRGGRGGRRGGASTRGGKGHSSSPLTENSPTAPVSITSPPAAKPPTQQSDMPPQQPLLSTTPSKNSSSSSLPRPPPGVDLPAKPKSGPRRTTPHHAADKVPALTIEPASPTANSLSSAPRSASTTSSRLSMPARRRRSHNKPSGAALSAENLTVETLASAMKARKSRSGPSSPRRPKDTLSIKNEPAHHSAAPTLTTFSAKANIDSLVEHVRAFAMDHNRPTTPGSHIDWAGDEDDTLPDLDDWGVAPSSGASANANPPAPETLEKAQVQLMSPILDDSLKQLPQNFDKVTPSPSVGSHSLSPHIANAAPVPEVNGPHNSHGDGVDEPEPEPVEQVENPEGLSPGPTEPPSQPSPASARTDPQPLQPPELAPSLDTEPSKDSPPAVVHLPSSASEPPAPPPTSSATPPPAQPETQIQDVTVAEPASKTPEKAPTPEPEFDINKRGLPTSIHAHKSSSNELAEPTPSAAPTPAPAPALPRNSTHGRSRTVGRERPFSAGAAGKHGAGADAKGLHHARTQSTPTSTGAVSHRRQHSRPVITTDAVSRIRKSLGTVLPKREVATAATTRK